MKFALPVSCLVVALLVTGTAPTLFLLPPSRRLSFLRRTGNLLLSLSVAALLRSLAVRDDTR